MCIWCNGTHIPLDKGQPLLELLVTTYAITMETGGVAVSINGKVILRAQWHITNVHPGDRVEVIHAVQGG